MSEQIKYPRLGDELISKEVRLLYEQYTYVKFVLLLKSKEVRLLLLHSIPTKDVKSSIPVKSLIPKKERSNVSIILISAVGT